MAIEIFFGLLVAVAALTWLAQRLRIEYPILLVIGGLLIGFIPGLPTIQLSPDVVFLLFLPPLLYYEAFTSSIRDFRANLRLITLNAVFLVIVTIAAVAPNAAGQAYNCAPEREILLRPFVTALCEALGIAPPRRALPRP